MRHYGTSKVPCVCGAYSTEKIVEGWEYADGRELDVIGVYCAPCRRKRGRYTRRKSTERKP